MKKIFASALILTVATGSMMALNCQRTIKAISAKEVKVEITINKDDVAGFARLSELIPEGSEIKYAKAEGGTFDIQSNKLKFIWMVLPKKGVVTVTYIVKTESLKQGDYSISGKFSYVDGEKSENFDIAPSSFNINSKGVANKVIFSQLLGPKSIVVYKLQLISTKDVLPQDYFSKNFKISEAVNVEKESGMNKYLMGQYQSQEEAYANQNMLNQNGYQGAVVVAYYNNKRITLSEARNLEGKK
jgi:hypothetical protein